MYVVDGFSMLTDPISDKAVSFVETNCVSGACGARPISKRGVTNARNRSPTLIVLSSNLEQTHHLNNFPINQPIYLVTKDNITNSSHKSIKHIAITSNFLINQINI